MNKIKKFCNDPKISGFLMALMLLLIHPLINNAYDLEVAVSGLAAIPFQLLILLLVCYFSEVKDLDYKRLIMGMSLGILLAVALLYVRAILHGITYSAGLFLQAAITSIIMMLAMYLWIAKENRTNEKKITC